MNNRKFIELICTNCGSLFNRDLSEYKRSVRLGRENYCTISCAISVRNKFADNSHLKNFYFKPGNVQDNTSVYTPFLYYMKKAKGRKWECDIDCEYLMEVWNKQMGKCAITGRNIYLKTHSTTAKDIGLFTASLDRIDSTKGYIKGNVQFISVGINLAKGIRDDEEVIEWLRVIKNGESEYNYVKSDVVSKMEQLVPI